MKPAFEIPAMITLNGQEITSVETVELFVKTQVCAPPNGCSGGCSTGTVKPNQ